jgi:Spy/CpxP family protein refolding chaperone
MKKLILMLVLFTAVSTINVQAQGGQGGDPAAMLARMKERMKPQLIEKTKLTDAQADKVIEINFEARSQMRGMRDLSEEDRKKKMDEVRAATDKKYKEMPLTDDQIKAVNDFYDEWRKNMQQQRNGGGGNQ